jgi:hypothetical protein
MTTTAPPARLSFGAAVTLAWLAGLAMVAFATSVVGLFLAPVAIPASVFGALRHRSWAVRIPLILGAFALAVLFAGWLWNGASLGASSVPVERR